MELQKMFRIAELKSKYLTLFQVICIVLLILWYVLSTYATRVMIVCGTIFGFTIITAVLVALSFLSFNDVAVYLVLGAILFLICAGLSLATLPKDSDGKLAYFIATGFFLANGVLFLIDFVLETKNKEVILN
uniref:Protein lifeguard 4 n=1 Tax=Bactrocera dorsalis TaxID=27457 RepID=A0A034WVL1_BACDO